PRPATPEACGALLGEYDGDGRAGPRSAGSPVRTHRLLTHKHPAALRRAPVRPRGERDAGPAGGLPCGSVARRLRNVRVSARSPPNTPPATSGFQVFFPARPTRFFILGSLFITDPRGLPFFPTPKPTTSSTCPGRRCTSRGPRFFWMRRTSCCRARI